MFYSKTAYTARLLTLLTDAPPEHHDDKIAGMTMVGAVDILEALFDKAQADLNYATHRIDHEFNEQYSKAGSPQVRSNNVDDRATILTDALQLNPLRLLQRYESLKNRVMAIRSRSQAIAERKQARWAEHVWVWVELITCLVAVACIVLSSRRERC